MILIIICFINRFHAQNCSENENSGCDLGIGLDKMMKNCVSIRPPRDVDVLAVLDFQIPCFRPESPALNPSILLTNQEAHGRKLGRPRRL